MIKNFIINDNISIKEALKKVEQSGHRCVYIEKKNKLIGSLTDGDIRKQIINNVSLDKKIKKIFNKNPKYLEQDKFTTSNVRKIFLKYNIDSLPITKNKKIIDIVLYQDLFRNKKPIKKNSIFIIAGGKGERLLPFTSILPKPLIPIKGVPIIKIIIDSFQKENVKNIFVSINYKHSIIKSYLKSEFKTNKIKFLKEKYPLGTIGSLKLVNEKYLSNNFIVTFCDVVFQNNMRKVFDYHEKNENDLTIVVAKKIIQIPYGVCKINKKGNFLKIDEKPSSNQFINVGYYIFNKKMLKYIIKGEKMDVTELMMKIKSGKNKIKIFPIEDGDWFDIGQWSNYKTTVTNFNVLEDLKNE